MMLVLTDRDVLAGLGSFNCCWTISPCSQMDGCWMHRWMDAQMDRRMDECTDGWIHRWMDDGWIDAQMDG